MMKKLGKSKLTPVAIALTLLLAMVVIMPQSFAAVEIDISRAGDLTYGDTIWVNVSGLTKGNDYEVYIEEDVKTSGWWETGISSEYEADAYGRVSMEVDVPFRNPLGAYKLSVYDVTGTPAIVVGTNQTITIANTYKVKFYVGGNEVSYLLHNQTYDSDVAARILTFNVYNGSSLVNWNINISILEPDFDVKGGKTNVGRGQWTPISLVFGFVDDLPNREVNYYVLVTPSNSTGLHSGEATNITLPVKLDVTVNVPTDVTYGDDDKSVSIYVKDRDGSDADEPLAGVVGYTVSLYSPCYDGTYELIETAVTQGSNGKYTFDIDTTDGSAGIWYVGTSEAGTYRINENYKLNIADFIAYGSFNVGTKTDGILKIESPDEIISGFNVVDMNVSVYEPNYDTEPTYYDEMKFHFTGLDAYYNGVEYDSDDIILVTATLDGHSSNSKYAYYKLATICFNETGTATIIATWPESNTVYTDFDNPDLDANISTSKTFSVVAADDLTMIVDDMVEEVLVGVTHSCGQKNDSTTITINLFGDNQDERMNASIEITGCGLDISIAEEDAIDEGYWCSEGVYTVDVSPKTAGTLTITATNDTEELSVSKDFTITGLSGSVTTSIDDDLEISVESEETITITTPDAKYADVYLTYFDEDWGWLACMNDTPGDNTDGKGLNGVYNFIVTADDIEDGIGYIVVAANSGSQWMYDIVEVAPVHDLEIQITSPVNATSLDLTVGLKHTYKLKVYDAEGNLMEDISDVVGKIIDEDHDEDDPLQTIAFTEKSGSIWQITDWIPYYAGTFVITATNDTGINEHDGNVSLNVDLATIAYSPDTATAGIEKEDLEISVIGKDANGDVLPDGTILYLNVENDFSLDINDATVTLDEDGAGTFTFIRVGDNDTYVNATLVEAFSAVKNGNKTYGQLTVGFPDFVVTPSEIYIGETNEITITAKDNDGAVIEGINITLLGSSAGVISSQPDPVETDENGMVILSVAPQASGKLNVTIARNVGYVGGQLDWDNTVVTDTYITVTSLKTMTIEVSKSPIYEGETLTVTIRSGIALVSGADVTFAGVTKPTGSDGTAAFTVPDPGNIDYAIYKIKAQKTGYITPASEDVTVLKEWDINIVVPEKICAGESFSVTIIAKGQPLAGASVALDGGTPVISGGDGKVTFTAGAEGATHTITATYESYNAGSKTTSAVAKCTPGFELLTLIVAIGVAFILLRRRKHN